MVVPVGGRYVCLSSRSSVAAAWSPSALARTEAGRVAVTAARPKLQVARPPAYREARAFARVDDLRPRVKQRAQHLTSSRAGGPPSTSAAVPLSSHRAARPPESSSDLCRRSIMRGSGAGPLARCWRCLAQSRRLRPGGYHGSARSITAADWPRTPVGSGSVAFRESSGGGA